MAAGAWIKLPESVSAADVRALQARLKPELRSFFADGGIRLKTNPAGEAFVRSDPQRDLVYALPLQTADGRIRRDAEERLDRDTFGTDLADAVEVATRHEGFHPSDVDRWDGLRLAFLQARTPLDAVRDLYSVQPEFRMLRLSGSDTLFKRMAAWRMIENLIAGETASDMALGSARQENILISGLMEGLPGHLICAPLTARFQPLAMVLMARNGAEIAVVPPGSFLRGLDLKGFPIGMGGPSLFGQGLGIYRTAVKRLPPNHGVTLLHQMTEGTNKLLYWLTDPAVFEGADARFDPDKRLITWANVRFGINAVNAMAAHWGDPETIWAAFRALGTLQGIWEGRRQGAIPLRNLLDPDLLRGHALDKLRDPTHVAWATGLVSNFEAELARGFPGKQLDEQLRAAEEIRHLVHGVGGQGRRAPDVRLNALRDLSRSAPNLQLVCDMAALWWTALILAPESLCRPGRSPWET